MVKRLPGAEQTTAWQPTTQLRFRDYKGGLYPLETGMQLEQLFICFTIEGNWRRTEWRPIWSAEDEKITDEMIAAGAKVHLDDDCQSDKEVAIKIYHAMRRARQTPQGKY